VQRPAYEEHLWHTNERKPRCPSKPFPHRSPSVWPPRTTRSWPTCSHSSTALRRWSAANCWPSSTAGPWPRCRLTMAAWWPTRLPPPHRRWRCYACAPASWPRRLVNVGRSACFEGAYARRDPARTDRHLGGRERPGEQVALAPAAARAKEEVALGVGLAAFRDHLDLHSAPQREDGSN